MNTTCCKTLCAADATHTAKLCIPAQGHPIDTHQPISLMLGLPLCLPHAREIDPALFLSPALRGHIEDAAALRAPPDFARAFAQPVAFASDEYRAYAQALAGNGGGR